ncbi:MAG: RnfABCDGE type electron transport complex subunit D [Candidatus Geothermincolales bacterium]
MEAHRLVLSSSPHVRERITTRSIMLQVILALMPVTVYSVVIHGVHAFYVLFFSIAGAVLGEYWCRRAEGSGSPWTTGAPFSPGSCWP